MTESSKNQAGIRTVAESWEALFRAQVEVMRRISTMEEFGELSIREYDVLFNLRNCPQDRSRMVDLNKHLLISQPSLSRMINRLESRGLVQREVDEGDHRAQSLSLTDAGRELQAKIGRAHMQHLHQLMGQALDESEFLELQRLCQKLRGNLLAD
ncbi:MarR family winged helix-turn-helix transcriptional regulator [Glutamicibacter endophyticus]|uniref:MarR family winged helix-turn-helix transcriptional regulator n=1 Tax=Glutamicibacter endophyticus TaxID=1522174 RepID=UPI003AF190A5